MITVEEQLITVKVGQSIDWRIDRFKKGSKNYVRRPRTEDRTRTRRSWHNILEACSGCQHFMLVVSESQLAVAATATAADISLRTVRVFPLPQKKVLERRSQNNRTHSTPWWAPLCVRRKQRQLLTTHYDTKLETKSKEVRGNLLRGPGDRHFIAQRTGPAWIIALFYPFLALFLSFSRSAPFDALNLREPNLILLLNFFVLCGNS